MSFKISPCNHADAGIKTVHAMNENERSFTNDSEPGATDMEVS